jgi:hypothetical protein
LIIAAVLFLLALLALLWCCCRKRAAEQRAKKIEEKIEKVNGLASVMEAAKEDPLGVDADAVELLSEAIRQSHQQGRPLPEVAQQLLAKHDGRRKPEFSKLDPAAGPEENATPSGMVVVEDRKQFQMNDAWPSVLHAAYEAHLQRAGKRAEHDREALEALHSQIHEVSEAPLKVGRNGGGGIHLRPPSLLPSGETIGESAPEQLASRPDVDTERLPPVVMRAAAKLKSGQQEGMGALRQMLEDYSILPGPVAAALMAEYAMRNEDAPPATEKQQVDLLRSLNNGLVLADHPWGVRVSH